MPPTAEATLVPGFEHRVGHHCGSTALRNLLAFHGAELSEEMCFGLGAGACFYYVKLDGQSPSRFMNGRTAKLEEDFLSITGAPLRMHTFTSAEESWAAARERIDSGAPSLLLTDLYYLDHYGNSAHFPGHAVVLAGYDDEFAWLSDTAFEELQSTRLENLSRARHGKHPIFPLDGQMLTLAEGAEIGDLSAAAPEAIRRCAGRMLEPPMAPYEGMPALELLADEVGSWPEVLDDWAWCARFGYQVIERRGTGGGNFRAMYSRFLAEAGEQEGSRLAAAASKRWSELAAALLEASDSGDEPVDAQWRGASDSAASVRDAERALWEHLAAF